MVEIVPYKTEHAIGAPLRNLYGPTAGIVTSEAYLRFLEGAGPGYSLFVDGRCVGSVVFVKLFWPGVAEVVLLLSEPFDDHMRMAFRICKRSMEAVQREHGFHRLQAKIRADSHRNRRWAEAMGFTLEGPLEAFGPNEEDFIEMVRIRRRNGAS